VFGRRKMQRKLVLVGSLVAMLLAMASVGRAEPIRRQPTGPLAPIQKGWNSLTGWMTPEHRSSSADVEDPVSLSTSATPSPKLYLAVGQMYERGGDFQAALAQYQKALELSPNSQEIIAEVARMYTRWGRHEELRKNWDGALARYQKSLELDRTSIDPVLEIARLQTSLGRKDQALQIYRRAMQVHPNSAKLFNNLGTFHAQRREFAESITAFERAIQLDPTNIRSRNNVAIIYVELGDLQRAFTHLTAVYPEDVAYYNMGFVLHQKGDDAQARRHFITAVHKNPQFQQAREMLAVIDRKLEEEAQLARTLPAPAETPSAPAETSPGSNWWQRRSPTSGPVASQADSRPRSLPPLSRTTTRLDSQGEDAPLTPPSSPSQPRRLPAAPTPGSF